MLNFGSHCALYQRIQFMDIASLDLDIEVKLGLMLWDDKLTINFSRNFTRISTRRYYQDAKK